jgi:hypothetical protein
MDIDFVVTWVDMDDPAWKEEFAKYAGKIDNSRNAVSEARFRDYGFLKYWFRSVEKFAPWVRKVHFVTCGQKLEWLSGDHPKINLVSHRDYIPEQFLPCFNSTVIERYVHKIPGLAEHFVYFNDDFFIINTVGPDRFFKDGLPCDIAAFCLNIGVGTWYKRVQNNVNMINRHFNKREVMRAHRGKWFNKVYGGKARWNYLLKFYPKFVMLRTPHNAQPFTKTLFEEVWQNCGNELTAVSANRFRSLTDYSPELFRAWQICSGKFEPYNTYADTKMFPLILKSKQAVKAVRNQSYKLVCLNDNAHIRNYQKVMRGIQEAFESILPEKSEFEI